MKNISLLVALLMVFGVSAANATLVGPSSWSGSWGGSTIDYSILQNGSQWTYQYTWSSGEKGKALSHIITQVSENFTNNNIFPGTTAGWDLDFYDDKTQGKSNPGLTPGIFGLKWNTTTNDPLTFSWTIVTDRAPMEGIIYAKDGVVRVETTKVDVWAKYNVLVPDTVSVPEAATMLLFGLGLVGIAGMRRMINRK